MKKILLFLSVSINLTATDCYAQVTYIINPTGQVNCYNTAGDEIKSPNDGDMLYGQDANYDSGIYFQFVDNGDGTIIDQNTGLMWQQTPPMDGMTWAEAKEYCENLEYGGYSDWRLPTLKELFSISDFSEGWPYLNQVYFNLSSEHISKDEQYWADNKYLGETVEGGADAAFGVNHVTGHIKAYPSGANMRRAMRDDRGDSNGEQRRPPRMNGDNQGSMPPPPQQMAQQHGQRGRAPKSNPMAKQVRAVRGEIYGENNFVDNGDGTVSDLATGLMWSRDDNGEGVEWITALPYAEGATLAGYTDWRLPNVKELQSIVDYSLAPSSKGVVAAINPIFNCTPFINEAGDDDYGYYWSNTSACFRKGNPFCFAWYVAFGRAVNNRGADFHGAGAVRFDSKSDNETVVEGGEERYYNFVRLVRNIQVK
ncbi:MAG: DUF1566 domain-containing protein [Bacteroidales bacterium]